MRVPDNHLEHMHQIAGLSRETLHLALRQMGPSRLKTAEMRRDWSDDNPTKNFCYVIAEMVFYYLAPPGSTSWLLRGIPENPYPHRFVRWPDGQIIDLAVHQFEDYESVRYDEAQQWSFMHTGKVRAPSRRCRDLAKLCGLQMDEERASRFGFDSF